jgi:5-methylcytosine-specific restriction endonuclease McrA
MPRKRSWSSGVNQSIMINTGRFLKGNPRQILKNCLNCLDEFPTRSGQTKLCPTCLEYEVVCPECGKPKSIYHQFCGNSCAGKWKYRNSEKVKAAFQFARINPEICKRRGIATGNAQRGKPKYGQRGEKNWNWKGGTYRTEHHRLMGRIEYSNWRKLIFERDNYTCVFCGKHGGNLEVDHIKPFYTNPELIFDLSNGRTVCIPCHKKLPTWGHKVKTQYKGEKNVNFSTTQKAT